MTAPVVSIESAALQRGMPANIEAEQFVLGSILLDEERTVFRQVAGALTAAAFNIEKHLRIFQRMGELHSRGERIEYLTVVDELEKHDQLKSCDGIAYISSLTDGLPRLKSIDSYIRIVKDKARLRELIRTCHGVASRALDGSEEPDQLIADAQSRFLKLTDGSGTKTAVATREIAERYPGGVSALLDPSKGEKGLSTPFARFDQMTSGLHPGELIIIAARPSMGKTALALNIAEYVASNRQGRTGQPVALFSLEMSQESLMQRLLCAAARVDSHRYRDGYLNQEERRRLSAALTSITSSRLFIDDKADTNVMEVGAKCRRIQGEHGLALVVLDYLQLLSSVGRRENRTQEMTAISRSLKLLARDLDVPIIALSQLNRSPELRANNRPQLSDLRESGSIEQDADLVAFIFREEVYKPDQEDLRGRAELNIAKQRNGPIGRIPLTFVDRFMRFEDLAEREVEEGL